MSTEVKKKSASKAPTRSKLSLKGSSKIVSEFFEYSINSILYQRGIYPPDDFQMVKKYGLNMLVTADEDVKKYIRRILAQLHKWILGEKISKLIVAITSKDTGEVAERWQFDVEIFSSKKVPVTKKSSTTDENTPSTTSTNSAEPPVKPKNKAPEEIQAEIQAIIRQITASVTFLPVLEGNYTFNVLVYADNNAEVPSEWIDSDPKEIKDAEQVKLRSFSTNSHKVDTLVSYRLNTDY